MTRESLRRVRYAPETGVVEIAVAVLERARVTVVAEHPRLLGRDELASHEERLARALVRAIERLTRSATRYLEYVGAIANDATVARESDPRQVEMF